MNCYGAKDLAAAFRTVRGNTIQIAEDIPEDQYSFRPTPDTRSVAETLVHIAIMPGVPERIHFVEHRSTLAGFDFMGLIGMLRAEEKTPRSKAEILEMLRTNGEKFAQLLEGADDNFLSEQVHYPEGMMPPVKTRFEMLMAPKEHEMHHRGQLMLMERLLGIAPHLTVNLQKRIAEMEKAQAAH
jgi:uncharacterized damage-inducible protein DinB